MKILKFAGTTGAVTAILLAGTAFAQQGRPGFDYRESLPYRQDLHQETRGTVYWSRGDRLPEFYRSSNEFRVRDLRGNNLRPPPRGQYWVRVSNQFLLINAGGQISQVIRIEDRGPRDWGNPPPDRNFPDRGPPPRIGDPGDDQARWNDRYHRTFTANDDSFYRDCQRKTDPAGVVIGAVLGGLLGNAAGGRNNNGAATFAGVIAGGAIGASLSTKLDCEDRSYAYRTYSDGFNAGRTNATYQWNNPQNNRRGELHVNNYYDDPDGFRCATYSQTIYIDGRPQEASGRACRQPDGAWAMLD